MPSINYDVLLLIAEHVDQQTYLRLLRVCRGWHALLCPKAYRRISVGNSQIYPLVCCIFRNPRIAAAIRDLDVSWDVEEPVLKCKAGEVEFDASVLEAVARRMSDDLLQRERWKGLLQHEQGHSDQWVAVLLLSLEAVTNLVLDYSEGYYSGNITNALWWAARLKPPFDVKPVLQRLERVMVKTNNSKIKKSFDATRFLPFFYLPAMQVFSGHSLSEGYWIDPEYPRPRPGTSSIKELRLGGAGTGCNGSRGMADYITTCANLEILEYQHENYATPGTTLTFHPGAIYTALVTQKHSLRELRLNDMGDTHPNGCDDNNEDNVHYNRFGSLVEFRQLRDLAIPVRTLLSFGWGHHPTASLPDILPSSLEYLYLADCWHGDIKGVIDDLECMVTQRTERFPNLRKLRIEPAVLEKVPGLRPEIPVDVQEAFAPLIETCREAGIDFCLVSRLEGQDDY